MDKNLTSRIEINPKVMVGKPVIKGTRLTVPYILDLLASGATIHELLEHYGPLEEEDILACLAYTVEVNSGHWNMCPSVEQDPDKLGGAFLFKGTRVPIRALFDNLKDGATVEDFLNWFPGVKRKQVGQVLSGGALHGFQYFS